MKAYEEAHREELRKKKASYRTKNKEQIRFRDQLYRQNRSAELRLKNKAYYLENRDRLIANVKARATAHPDKISAYHVKHYAMNAERIKANVSVYRKAYPEKKAHLENRRRARKAGNGGSHTLAQRLEKFSRLGNRCFYCGKTGRLTVDHDVPLKRGGTDDISNVLPACRSCNSKKNAKTSDEFIGMMALRNIDRINDLARQDDRIDTR